MNTVQTYTGKSVPANSPLARHYQDLYTHVDEFAQESRAGSDVECLSELFYAYLAHAVGYDEYADDRKMKRYELREHHLEKMLATHRLMVNVTQIKEKWVIINSFEQTTVGAVAPVTTASPTSANVNSIDPTNEPWHARFLTDLLADSLKTETLFQMLDHLLQMHDRTDPTAAITKLLGEFTDNPKTDLSDIENRQLIRTITTHIADLNEYRSNFYCFDNVTGYINMAASHE